MWLVVMFLPESTALDKVLSATTILSEHRILMKLEWGKEEVRYGRKEKQDEGFGTKLDALCELAEGHFEEEEDVIYVQALGFH